VGEGLGLLDFAIAAVFRELDDESQDSIPAVVRSSSR